MSVVLDIIVLAIILVTVFLSAKRGFVRVLIELVGFVAAVFISFTISTPLADMTYDKIIEPPIVASVGDVTGDSVEETVNSVWDALPGFVQNSAERFGITTESLNESISSNIGNGAESAVKNASQELIKPLVTKPIALIYIVISVIIMLFVVKILAKVVNKMFSFSLVGTANRVLGGIVGIPKGIIMAMVFCLVISLIVSFTTNGFLIFTDEAMEKSWFFSHLSVNLL